MPYPALLAPAAVAATLLVANLLNNRFARRWYLPTSLLTAALLLGLFRLAGLGLADAGLAGRTLAGGARWALASLTLVAFGYLVGALLPATRRVFVDRRVRDAGVGAVIYQSLVRIPFGTVLLEEVAFRGVLYGLLREWYGVVWATAVSSVLFGLWHVLPARELTGLNPATARTFHGRPRLVPVAAVLVTALAGVLLCELRRRSASLLAPVVLHWAVNALGYLTAYVITRHPSRIRR